MTGVKPSQEYGYTAIGAAPSAISACRRNITSATGLVGSGYCPTATLKWAFRHGKYKSTATADPRVYMPLTQISAWTDLWNSRTHGIKDRIRNIWRGIIKRLRVKKSRWQQVRGPMSATAATLLDMAWGPVHPDKWVEPTKVNYVDISARPGIDILK
jgi:hypothetical protein